MSMPLFTFVTLTLLVSISSVTSQAYYHDEPPHHPQPYNFGYKIHDGYGNHNYQEESGDSYGNKKGSYGFTDAHGVYRKVDYIADDHGFRAKITTNEPGTAPADSANVHVDQYHGHHHAPVAPAPAYHAPVYVYRPSTVYAIRAPPPAPYIPAYHYHGDHHHHHDHDHHPVDHYDDHHHHHHHHRSSK